MFYNIKRGLVRLWIVLAVAVDVILTIVVGSETYKGFPLGTPWSTFLLVMAGMHVLWFSILAAVLWVLNGFFLKTE